MVANLLQLAEHVKEEGLDQTDGGEELVMTKNFLPDFQKNGRAQQGCVDFRDLPEGVECHGDAEHVAVMEG